LFDLVQHILLICFFDSPFLPSCFRCHCYRLTQTDLSTCMRSIVVCIMSFFIICMLVVLVSIVIHLDFWLILHVVWKYYFACQISILVIVVKCFWSSKFMWYSWSLVIQQVPQCSGRYLSAIIIIFNWWCHFVIR